MKTFADFKRQIKVGDKVEIKNHLHGRNRKTEIEKQRYLKYKQTVFVC